MLRKDRGMVLFVVLGGIFILTILIMSYNHLVRGKFNESREIIRHLRAMKVAQSVSRYLIARFRHDLKSDDMQPGSTATALRKAFSHSSETAMKNAVNDDWLMKVINEDSFDDLKRQLFVSQTTRDVSISSRFSFDEIIPLSSLKKGDEIFFDFEKAGRINLTVEVYIGRSREVWSESRPFRVVMPFPVPLTKFTMYVRSAGDSSDEMKFNTVTIESPDSGNVAPGSSRPLTFFNGMPGSHNNARENIWEDRGWIYLGGGRISLNRAGGHKGYGQGFHSYFPEADKPITLDFNYNDRTGQKFQGVDLGNRTLMFTVARWGFAKTLYQGPHSDIWKQVLRGEVLARDPNSMKKAWASSCLHLFGSGRQQGTERLINMTRVVGDVRDRFLDICYFAEKGTRQTMGAVVAHGPNTYANILGSNSSESFVNNLIYFSVPVSTFGVSDLQQLEPFFRNLRYSEPGNTMGYRKIMSKIDSNSYDSTYNLISQYCKNYQRIDIPPQNIVPATDDYDFKLEVMGKNLSKLRIDKIAESDDATLGLSKRVCYEINQGQGEDAFNILKENFCSNNNSDFNLANTVVRIKTNGAPFRFGDNLGTRTGGSIIVDGDISLGTFVKSDKSDKSPVMIMAEKGNITVKNSSDPTLAYLVALDKNAGRIKFADPASRMYLMGGFAAHTIDPEDVKGGGIVNYNTQLDPTKDNFSQYIGVALGPPGGEL